MPRLSLRRTIAKALGRTPSDQRNRRLVAVVECILNQNARDCGAATYPALNKAFLQLCIEHDIGIVQIPCPEMRLMGLQRERAPGKTIHEVLDTPVGHRCCQAISQDLVTTLQDYQKNGCRVLAILGGNPESPGCAVHPEGHTHHSGLPTVRQGVLMRILQDELRKHQIKIPFRGLRDYRPDLLAEDLRWLEQLFSGT